MGLNEWFAPRPFRGPAIARLEELFVPSLQEVLAAEKTVKFAGKRAAKAKK
jgi:hypothetical protein